MSANDSPFDPPADVPSGVPSIASPSPDLQQTPDNMGTPTAGWSPELGLPERTLTQKPRWPHPNFGWSFLWCLLFVIVTQLPGAFIAVAVVAGLAFLSPDTLPLETLKKPADLMRSEAMTVALAVAFFFTELIVIGFSWLIIRVVVGRDWTRQLALRRPSLSHTLLVLASLPALWLMASIAYELLHTLFHVPSLDDLSGMGMKEMERVFSKWPWGFAVLVIGLGPGIGEELWCRGFLGRGLVGNYGAIAGIVAASFFFGLIHIDPCQGTMAMLMGLWLHFVYLTTRSLLLPMLLHFLNNSLSVLALRLPRLQLLDSEPQAVPVTIYVSALLLLGCVAYALYQSRTRLAAKSPEQPLAWRPAFEGVEYPPPDSGMRVIHPMLSPMPAALVGGAFLLFVWACAAWIAAS